MLWNSHGREPHGQRLISTFMEIVPGNHADITNIPAKRTGSPDGVRLLWQGLQTLTAPRTAESKSHRTAGPATWYERIRCDSPLGDDMATISFFRQRLATRLAVIWDREGLRS